MERQPLPPGTILAAGGLIGTGLATLALVAPTIPARLAESPYADRLASFDLALDALGVLFALGMLACAAGLVVRGASFVTWSLALVVVHGIFQLGGAAIEKTVFGGTSTLLTLRLLLAAATALLCIAPLLAAYFILERRRAGSSASALHAPSTPALNAPRAPALNAPRAPARRALFVVAEGIAACLVLGVSVLAMTVLSRSLAALYDAQMPHEATTLTDGEEPGSGTAPAEGDPGFGSAGSAGDPAAAASADAPFKADGDAAAAAAIFRKRLMSVDGRLRPLWNQGPQATLVDFWASWCGPCLYELPNLEVLQDRLRDRGVEVVLANVDLEESEAVGRFLGKRRIGLGSLVDKDASIFQELGLSE